MKRFLFIVAAMVMCLGVQAQIVSSSSSRVVRIVEEKPKKPVTPFNTKHYIKGGVNVNEMYGDFDCLLEIASVPGLHLLYGMEKPFSKNAQWACTYWGFEAGASRWAFSLDGGNLKGAGAFPEGEKSHWRQGSWPSYDNICRLGLHFAPRIGFKIGSRGKKISMGVEAGAYVNYNLKSSYILDEYDYSDIELTAEFKETTDLLMEAFFNEWNDLEAGTFFGVGFWIKRVYLGVRYAVPITPSFLYTDDKELIPGYFMPSGSYTHDNLFMSIAIAF